MYDSLPVNDVPIPGSALPKTGRRRSSAESLRHCPKAGTKAGFQIRGQVTASSMDRSKKDARTGSDHPRLPHSLDVSE